MMRGQWSLIGNTSWGQSHGAFSSKGHGERPPEGISRLPLCISGDGVLMCGGVVKQTRGMWSFGAGELWVEWARNPRNTRTGFHSQNKDVMGLRSIPSSRGSGRPALQNIINCRTPSEIKGLHRAAREETVQVHREAVGLGQGG